MAWDEDRIHRWLLRRPVQRGLAGSAGHDAAVLVARPGRPVVCVDQTVEGVHFAPGTPAAKVGAKAAGRALSDLAATAARPTALVLALAAPPDAEEAWLKRALAAVGERGARFGAELVGGDLAAAPGPIHLSVTALGVLEGRRRPPGRDRATPGQDVLITGPVGGSRARRHLAIEPRVAEGRWLWERGATALMDVSDGLAWDLHRLARASGVRIDLEFVPVHPDAERAARASGKGARWHALHDGEDYELIATLAPGRAERALAAARRVCPGLVRIGRVRRGSGLHVQADGAFARWTWEGGWRHGR